MLKVEASNPGGIFFHVLILNGLIREIMCADKNEWIWNIFWINSLDFRDDFMQSRHMTYKVRSHNLSRWTPDLLLGEGWHTAKQSRTEVPKKAGRVDRVCDTQEGWNHRLSLCRHTRGTRIVITYSHVVVKITDKYEPKIRWKSTSVRGQHKEKKECTQAATFLLLLQNLVCN